ncbi:SDR family oxidoreductase [Aggregatimonas sangjinii]|uniref:SDR family oxidoreductase n=1 Tax=Aggregatimonas sangjinii TaxID=2583587 RepID=A0A5B7SSL7_9FLAO|nr:SDR family oxidoreductase [Aggregatimonas sangjinii]QCW99970.1 SDR family oxidoreductase [Aggregatimonas sangjinii]
MDKKDKKGWALILGGSSGLGLATAKKLAKNGFDILIVHRDRKADAMRIDAHFKEISLERVRLESFNMDAVNLEKRAEIIRSLKTMLKNSQGIRVLVHSIAKGNLKPMRSEGGRTLSNADFQLTVDAMALSLYDWVKALHAEQLFAEDSRVISFTSEGNQKAWANYAAVSAAKAVLEAITRNIALEFADSGIKANCLQAGITDTTSFRMIPGHEALKKNALLRNPNGRLTSPEDVANVAYLLTTEDAKWITGTVIKVDGGESLR